MPKALWVLFLAVGFLSANGQNLIPNPGFELLKKTPPCSYIHPGENISSWLYDWQMPTGGTTDIWYADSTGAQRTCSQNTLLTGVRPYQGRYCIGLYAAGSFANNPQFSNLEKQYREYAQVRLIQPLQPGKIYYAEMYVLLAELAAFASNNIGFLFSVNPVLDPSTTTPSGDVLDYTPQVKESRVLDKPKKWVKVSGCFMAEQACQYLTIGNFSDDKHTSFVNIEYEDYRLGSYYLIDNISVVEANATHLIPANFLGADTTLCPRQSLTITLPKTPGVTYSGLTANALNQLSINTTGIYSVTATAGQCLVMDTLQVMVEPPVVLPADTTLCRGDVLTLAPQPTKRRYNWNDGSTDSTLAVRDAGTYWVRTESRFCILTDTITVSLLDCPGEVPNVITPNGDGRNDRFVIPNIQLVSWHLDIVNRWGRRVYETEAYKNDWEGNGLPAGFYYYLLSDRRSRRQVKGWVQIIR